MSTSRYRHVLEGYATFVDYVRMNCKRELTKEYFEENIRYAMDRCIQEGILVNFFRERYDEVLKNMVLDYSFERRLELAADEYREIGRKEGFEEGREEGRKDAQREMLNSQITRLRNRGMQDVEIMDLLGCTEVDLKNVSNK